MKVMLSKSFCPLLLVFIAIATIGYSQEQDSGLILGTLFAVSQNSTGVLLTARVISSERQTLLHLDTLFTTTQLPSTCGERLSGCLVKLVSDFESERAIAALTTNNGIALALYRNLTTNEFVILDQHLIGTNLSCDVTSLVVTRANRLFASCLQPSSVPEYEVNVWIYEVFLNFTAVDQSYLQLRNPSGNPYQSFSHELSRLIPYTENNNDLLLWVDDETLFVVLTNFVDEFFFATPPGPGDICFSHNVVDVKLLDVESRLLTYCANNTLLNYDLSVRGGNEVNVDITNTRFPCTVEENGPYLEERNGMLTLFSANSEVTTSIPHPLRLDQRYVGDCVMGDGVTYFIGTSTNGTIVMTDVMNGRSTVLTRDALVDHVVVDGHLLVYSGFNFSVVLDLDCPDEGIRFETGFLLSKIVVNQNYSCATGGEDSGGQIVGIACAVGLFVLVFILSVIIIVITLKLKCSGSPQSQRYDRNLHYQASDINASSDMAYLHTGARYVAAQPTDPLHYHDNLTTVSPVQPSPDNTRSQLVHEPIRQPITM